MISLAVTLFLTFSSLLLQLASGQLIGSVGPTTPLSDKTIECNVLEYGAVADNSTDISTALHSAFESCVLQNPGSRLIVPAGNYLLNQSVVLSNGTNWAFQLDGLITASYNGNWTVDRGLILQGFAGVSALNATINGEGDQEFLLDTLVIVNAVDFEFYSQNGLGAFQGQGYLYRISGNTERPRLVRLISPINSSVHDLLLIDSPKFHFVFDFAINIEVYHLTIRGGNLGSYDGIDAIGTNYWVHDNEVTNRDECVSVKSPSNHAFISNLVCNQVGSGVSIGSLNVSASISNIHATNISVITGNEIAFIKTYPGGSGFVTNVTFENFRSKGSLYGLNINQYWQETFTPDDGSVTLSNILFRNFTGSIADGAVRPPLFLQANDLTFAENISVTNFSLWTEEGTFVVNEISNVFTTPDSVNDANDGIPELTPNETPLSYTTSITVTTTPTAWASPTLPTWAAASTGYGTDVPIPVYTPAALWKPQGDYEKHYWGTF